MTTYYVSANNGSNSNAGTSVNASLATLQAAEALVKPGDTVQVMNGTYTGPSGGDVLQITTSGTASAPITFEAAPGQTPVIDSSGTWNGIDIEASNIIVNGFTVVGDAANYTLQQALAGYSTGNSALDGNGIIIQSSGKGAVPNHITIENNTVYNEPGGGIATIGADYVQILNNVVHDNALWSAYGNSGISVYKSANSDTNPGIHDVISGNISYNNTQLVPTSGAGRVTDGEGIILDTNTGFVGQILVQGNTTYGNSGPGIESFLTNNAIITGNTAYRDLTNAGLASEGEIFINQSNNDAVTNNSTTPPSDLLTPQATTINATTGQLFSGTVATFTDSNTSISASALTATINWGDGSSTTAGAVTGGNGSFVVAGSHTYSTAGSDTVAVTLTESSPNTGTATADSTADVSSPPPPPPPSSGTTMMATSNGVTENVQVITSGSSSTNVGSGLVSQSVSSGIDTVSFTNITSETVQIGSGTVSMRFLSPGDLTLTGGSGTDAVFANSGANNFTAGTGTLDVTGGSGRDFYVFHSGDGLLKIEDFSKSRDSLTVDKSLRGAFQEKSDGHGGVMLTFGTSGQGVDLVGVSNLSESRIHFV